MGPPGKDPAGGSRADVRSSSVASGSPGVLATVAMISVKQVEVEKVVEIRPAMLRFIER